MKMDVETKGRKSSTIQRARQTRRPTKQRKQVAFKSIIVPIDFSETSIQALDYALSLAEESGSRLHLVHVLEFPAVFNATTGPSYALWDKEAKRVATARLAELVGEKVNEFIPVNSEVRFGRAYQAICETARTQHSDLIVIGTHGFTGLKHLLLGSTAERVVRHAPCSVLVVRKPIHRNARFVLKPKRILVPTDFSKPARAALQTAIDFAKQYGAKIHLLHVVPTHYALGNYEVVDYAMLAAEEKETGKKKLAALGKELLSKKISATAQLRNGRPAVEINETAADLDCDLIVISTHGYTGWKRVTLGSTTEEVVRHASCPTLVAKSL